MRILAIDPGTRASGAVVYDASTRRVVLASAKWANANLLACIVQRDLPLGDDAVVAVERVQEGSAETLGWFVRFVRGAEAGGYSVRWEYRLGGDRYALDRLRALVGQRLLGSERGAR